ncbi:ferredoxin [Microlunatus sp. GCM10028923]|uniref:ferredoxin n=1 Tax=Microlunatus sp. GCM10028923 TaxID=3273400 RepID=UPI0036160E1D
MPIKIIADRDVCVGSGNCAFTAPELFDQSEDDGTVLVIKDVPDPDQEEAAREAVSFCPSAALSLQE